MITEIFFNLSPKCINLPVSFFKIQFKSHCTTDLWHRRLNVALLQLAAHIYICGDPLRISPILEKNVADDTLVANRTLGIAVRNLCYSEGVLDAWWLPSVHFRRWISVNIAPIKYFIRVYFIHDFKRLFFYQ